MAFNIPRITFPFFPFYTKNTKGESFYDITSFNGWTTLNGTNIDVAENHPILTPAILFVSKLFSQAEFYLEDKKTKEKIYDHWVLDLLKAPNYYQTQIDFLETLNFTMLAAGKAVVYSKKIIGLTQPETLYLLNPYLIEYPDEFKTPLSPANSKNLIQNARVIYDKDGENLSIPFKDLLFFYDMPNGINTRNMFENKSRFDGLRQTLVNTRDSLLAKNIILKTNGKELITGDKQSGSFPLGDAEKDSAEKLFFGNYGLGSDRKRGLITKASLKWQSMHIALRDLGLDESVKVDGNIIYTALHIPKDILSLEAKKTTYNNFKESMVSYIQNEMQPTADAAAAVFQKMVPEPNLKLRATYDHLPIMQFILIERYEGVEQRGLALKSLRDAGLPDEIALDLCGFEKNVKLEKLIKPTQDGNAAKPKPAKPKK